MVAASAPGKLILFGEHAVVFGEPALSVAIDLRTRVTAVPASRDEVNGQPLSQDAHPYLVAGRRRGPNAGPLALTVRSDLPLASGMGSSAAVTTALLACLHGMEGDLDRPRLAREAFEVEHEVQGRASPIDTTTATQGGGVLLLRARGTGFLWRIDMGGSRWYLHRCDLPRMSLVVGSTGIQAATGPLVEGVRRLCEREAEARAAVRRIGEISLEGRRALGAGDLAAAGALMQENHTLLNALGVGHPRLDALVEASLPHAYGAKLTGAGGGGSMIALTEDPQRVREALGAQGAEALVVSTEPEGVRLERDE